MHPRCQFWSELLLETKSNSRLSWLGPPSYGLIHSSYLQWMYLKLRYLRHYRTEVLFMRVKTLINKHELTDHVMKCLPVNKCRAQCQVSVRELRRLIRRAKSIGLWAKPMVVWGFGFVSFRFIFLAGILFYRQHYTSTRMQGNGGLVGIFSWLAAGLHKSVGPKKMVVWGVGGPSSAARSVDYC